MLSDPKNNSLSLSMVEKKGNLLDQFHNFLYLYIGPRFKVKEFPFRFTVIILSILLYTRVRKGSKGSH